MVLKEILKKKKKKSNQKDRLVSETSASCAGDGCRHFRSLTLSHDSICKKKKIRMKHVNENSAKQSRDKKKNYMKVTDPLPPLHHW